MWESDKDDLWEESPETQDGPRSRKGAERFVTSDLTEDDLEAERSLRPQTLDEYIGQSRLKQKMRVAIAAAKERHEPLDHLLFYGPPGLGKTTLAGVIANEMGAQMKTTSGPAIGREGDLAAILTNLNEGDILFVDEIHRLPHQVEEKLYPAMEDFKYDIVIGKGPAARAMRLDVPRFTLIGATTRSGLLTTPLRDRCNPERLDYYTAEELSQIVRRSARILNVTIDDQAAAEISSRSRGTPRLANRLLKRVRDYAQVRHGGDITREVALEAMDFFEVDPAGLDWMDNRILETLVVTFQGKPVGLSTLASAVGEDESTLEEVYEPYLLQLGFINRTPKGRIATARAYDHLGVPLGDAT